MKTNEAQFYEVLENLFIGVKIEDKQENLLDPTPKSGEKWHAQSIEG